MGLSSRGTAFEVERLAFALTSGRWLMSRTAMSMTVSVFRPRKSNLTSPGLLDVVLVVLRDDDVPVPEARHVVPERALADDHAGRVHAGVAGQALELHAPA